MLGFSDLEVVGWWWDLLCCYYSSSVLCLIFTRTGPKPGFHNVFEFWILAALSYPIQISWFCLSPTGVLSICVSFRLLVGCLAKFVVTVARMRERIDRTDMNGRAISTSSIVNLVLPLRWIYCLEHVMMLAPCKLSEMGLPPAKKSFFFFYSLNWVIYTHGRSA